MRLKVQVMKSFYCIFMVLRKLKLKAMFHMCTEKCIYMVPAFPKTLILYFVHSMHGCCSAFASRPTLFDCSFGHKQYSSSSPTNQELQITAAVLLLNSTTEYRAMTVL